MEKIKDKNDTKGYSFASDDHQTTIMSFSDHDATDITIPEYINGKPVRKIGFGAFRGIENLRTVVMPDTVRIIENSAFRSCPSLTNVILSKNTQNLAPYAFASCNRLKTVTVPSDLRNLSDKTFNKCYSLTEFMLVDKNKNDGSSKRFVVASRNEHRRFGFIQACIIYFDNYSMKKFDEGYSVIQEFEDLFNIAEYRLYNPEQLSDYMRNVYENAIRMFIPKLIREDQADRLTSAGTLGMINPQKLDSYIELASTFKGSCLPYLLEFKEKNYKRSELDFSL